LGLAERGKVFTILQLGVQTVIGAAVFIGMSLILKMDEIKTLLRLLLRRTKAVEAT
jgi:hypothetical protein